MNREWKPGDVALVEAGCWANRKVALRLDKGWAHTSGVNVDLDGVVVAVRPLVVIDPEDGEAVERLYRTLVSLTTLADADRVQAALREYANPKPPRIDEPGTWGVVEASCVHSEVRREWVKFPGGNWHSVRELPRGCEDIENPDDWDSLIDPVLVRDGVDQ